METPLHLFPMTLAWSQFCFWFDCRFLSGASYQNPTGVSRVEAEHIKHYTNDAFDGASSRNRIEINCLQDSGFTLKLKRHEWWPLTVY